jgi:glycosyltransferase involved in cell wall biosynthesis
LNSPNWPLHIAFHYPGINLGGHQTYTLGLMRELVAFGHRVSWIYHYGDTLLADIEQIGTACRLPMPRFNAGRFGVQRVLNRQYYWRVGAHLIVRFCRREAVDVLVTASTPDTIIGNTVARRTGTRHFRFLGGSLRQVEPHWLARWPSWRIDTGITGYFGWDAVFDELAGVHVPREKCVSLPFAVDTVRHHPLPIRERLEIRRGMGLRDDALVIGWIGRTNRNMQVWDTVKLARRVRALGFENFQLLLVGGGDDFEALKAEVRDAGLADRSVLTGWMPYDRMNAMANAMDIVPLLEPDPHGGSIVREAMAAGRVALSVDGPSRVQQSFMHDSHAILVPSATYLESAAAAVVALARDPEQREQLGQSAAQYAREQMSFRRLAERFLAGIARFA